MKRTFAARFVIHEEERNDNMNLNQIIILKHNNLNLNHWAYAAIKNLIARLNSFSITFRIFSTTKSSTYT